MLAYIERINKNYTEMKAFEMQESMLDYIQGVNDVLEALGADYIITVDNIIFEQPTACCFYLNEGKIEKI